MCVLCGLCVCLCNSPFYLFCFNLFYLCDLCGLYVWFVCLCGLCELFCLCDLFLFYLCKFWILVLCVIEWFAFVCAVCFVRAVRFVLRFV